MRPLIAALMAAMFALGLVANVAAQAKSDCSKYTGVEKEACEKMAGKKR